MNNNYRTTIFNLIIRVLFILQANNVQGAPLNDIENKQLLSRIYTDDNWNHYENERDNQLGNPTWVSDISNSRKKEFNNECTGDQICTTTVEMPIKREMFQDDPFVSRGWGPGGMPFNVLYMKVPRSNKPSRSTSIIPEPLRNQPIPQAQQSFINTGLEEMTNNRGSEIMAQQIAQPSSTINNNKNDRMKGRNSNSMHVPSRRHYSIIPQLFVSYGWGPIGKRVQQLEVEK